ncbi:MAG: hypothetical protein QNJ40_12885 [Xanthomonadales bacterium]|nr:hypothetical protein [Xanthomonadales bacterium]
MPLQTGVCMSFFAELQRRNVVKVAVAYIVASWLLLQLAEVLTELLELSTDVGKMVILLLVIGFVPTVVFAWKNTMGVIWYALDREHLKHPAVLPWLEKAGVADYWRIAGDPDYCHRSGETFECG